MRVIYKYSVPADGDLYGYRMPVGSLIRYVAQQGAEPCMWVEVQTDAPNLKRSFRVFGTGHVVPDGFVYVGTAFDGPFVWHVFEKL